MLGVSTEGPTKKFSKGISSLLSILSKQLESMENLSLTDDDVEDGVYTLLETTDGSKQLTIPIQFLAYHVALLKNCDIDKPRNLAKSVTVE